MPDNQAQILRQALRLCAMTVLQISATVRDGYVIPGKSRVGMTTLYLVIFVMASGTDRQRYTISELARATRLDRSAVRAALKQLEEDQIVLSRLDPGELEVGYYWRFDILGKPPQYTQCRVDWIRLTREVIAKADEMRELLSQQL